MLTLTTRRLILQPLSQADASAMVAVLADPELYRFIGGMPPTLHELTARYRRLEAGSTDATQEWHNWIIRRRSDPQPIGTIQATIRDGGREATVAWIVGSTWQRQGFASEAAVALIAWLRGHDISRISAHINPAHVASARVAARAGLQATGELDADGEQIWRS